MLTIAAMTGVFLFIFTGFLLVAWQALRDKPPANTAQLEMMAQIVTMSYFAQKYGVNPDDLQAFYNPQAMEEHAKLLKAQAALKELQQQVSPKGKVICDKHVVCESTDESTIS